MQGDVVGDSTDDYSAAGRTMADALNGDGGQGVDRQSSTFDAATEDPAGAVQDELLTESDYFEVEPVDEEVIDAKNPEAQYPDTANDAEPASDVAEASAEQVDDTPVVTETIADEAREDVIENAGDALADIDKQPADVAAALVVEPEPPSGEQLESGSAVTSAVVKSDQLNGAGVGAQTQALAGRSSFTVTTRLLLLVTFPFDEIAFSQSALDAMGEAARALNDDLGSTAVITGYSDNSGDALYNMDLANDRASAVVEYLVSAGVERQRLTVNAGDGRQGDTSSRGAPAGNRERSGIVQIEIVPEGG
jgi:outer membrane protein OmpA-like peptidoglycan-associated protein